jgi:hypothetical protein
MKMRPMAPAWGQLTALVLALVWVMARPASSQPKATPKPAAAPELRPESKPNAKPDAKPDARSKKQGMKTFDFGALDLNGRMRAPQLLYFLERASEELERASLERRSFIPHLVRSLEEEAL